MGKMTLTIVFLNLQHYYTFVLLTEALPCYPSNNTKHGCHISDVSNSTWTPFAQKQVNGAVTIGKGSYTLV